MQSFAVPNRRVLIIDEPEVVHGGSPRLLDAVHQALTDFDLDAAANPASSLQKLQQSLGEDLPYAITFTAGRAPAGWDELQTIQRLWEIDPDLQVVVVADQANNANAAVIEKLGLAERMRVISSGINPAELISLAEFLCNNWPAHRAARIQMERLETMVEQRTAELTHRALHDELTDLPNRILFHERLRAAISSSLRDAAHTYAVLFIDLDRFKVINDTLGHAAGDAVLKCVAERLQVAITLAGSRVGHAMAARLGGDEFVILIERVADLKAATIFAEGLLRILATPHPAGDRHVQCTASIGITTSDLRYTKAEDVLRDADNAMYRAKAAGKGRCVNFDRPMLEEVTMRLEMENELRGAIDRGELLLHYQPIMSLADGSIHGFEALVRWDHPTRGMMLPLRFITCSEGSGSIGPIGIWILEQALRQLRIWQTKYPALSELSMSVNVSPKQFTPALAPYVEQVLKATQVQPRCLALEITESVLIADAESASVILQQIRALGVALHVDDFGTGYSALSTLHQFPLDGLKIDRKFMQNVSERRDYAAVVMSIVSLARNLKMKLIAEGIENTDQIALLQGMDCDFAQGYYFSRPQNAAGAEAFIEQHLAGRAAA